MNLCLATGLSPTSYQETMMVSLHSICTIVYAYVPAKMIRFMTQLQA